MVVLVVVASPLTSLMSKLSVISLLDTYWGEMRWVVLIVVRVVVVAVGAKEVTTCESRSGDAIDNFLMLELYSYGMICVRYLNRRQFEREVSEHL